MSWSPQRENLLRILWAQGLSCGQIAKQIGGVTRNAVIGKRIRLGLPDREKSARVYTRSGERQAVNNQPRKLKNVLPKLKPAPMGRSRAPERGPDSVQWLHHKPGQCEMFCAGEEGALGFVCGKVTEFGSHWCSECVGIVFAPAEVQERARRRSAA